MNFHLPAIRWFALPARVRGMFNLNDPRWGRGDDKPQGSDPSSQDQPPQAPQQPQRPQGQAGGPPDLDELWRDFNQKLGQLFGGKGGGSRPPSGGGHNGGQGGLPGFLGNPYACFRAADAFVSTARYEGFGNALAEAQARREGVLTLREAGLLKVRQGLTSLEEILGCTNA